MPVYEYDCPKHGKFDVIVSIRDHAETETLPCPQCDFKSPRQVSRKTNFELKGRGWAYDGYVQGLGKDEPQGGNW